MLAEVEPITMTIKSPFGWVTDISNLPKATPRQRQMYAESACHPFKIFSNCREGELWARRQLIARGVRIGSARS